LHNIAKNTTNQRKTGIRSQKYIFHETCSVLFSVLAGGKMYALCAIFHPYAHAMFACNARLLLSGIAENAKTALTRAVLLTIETRRRAINDNS